MNPFKLLINKIYSKLHPLRYAKNLGVKIGKNCRLIGNISYGSEPYLIKIGNHVSITRSTFITHDGGVWIFRDRFPKIDSIKPIIIGNNVFIGSDCTILPGVIIGDNTIIGAKTLLNKSLEGGYVYAGIPAIRIKATNEYFEKNKKDFLDIKGLNKDEKRNFLKDKFNFK